ncbi:hypothetical protein PROFUN_12511 [Planoprotostelium fungivorum]|uniref:Uncharacterized protein n=1 Tax=Planoprotostelium fungivorum TaxID=1890364 RepID=A0A2P6MS28_9EUKA|nr:hypothetical protein PROFUN_12511 [Planoprotostelium fungivorum]
MVVTALQWSSWRASSETGRPQQLGFQWKSNNLFQKEYTLSEIPIKDGPHGELLLKRVAPNNLGFNGNPTIYFRRRSHNCNRQQGRMGANTSSMNSAAAHASNMYSPRLGCFAAQFDWNSKAFNGHVSGIESAVAQGATDWSSGVQQFNITNVEARKDFKRFVDSAEGAFGSISACADTVNNALLCGGVVLVVGVGYFGVRELVSAVHSYSAQEKKTTTGRIGMPLFGRVLTREGLSQDYGESENKRSLHRLCVAKELTSLNAFSDHRITWHVPANTRVPPITSDWQMVREFRLGCTPTAHVPKRLNSTFQGLE